MHLSRQSFWVFIRLKKCYGNWLDPSFFVGNGGGGGVVLGLVLFRGLNSEPLKFYWQNKIKKNMEFPSLFIWGLFKKILSVIL